MPLLNLDEIQRDAQSRMQVVEMTRALQSLVEQVYPGHRVFIAMPDAPAPEIRTRRRFDFSALTGTDQVMHILRTAPEMKLSLNEILELVGVRGGTMSMETLMSLLSRGRDTIFENVERGVWRLRPEALAL